MEYAATLAIFLRFSRMPESWNTLQRPWFRGAARSFRKGDRPLVRHESDGAFQACDRPGELGWVRHRRLLDLKDDLKFLQSRFRRGRVVENLADDHAVRRRLEERRTGGTGLTVLR